LENEKLNISVKELYEEYSDDILRYSFSIVRNYEEAKDIVQEVFTRHLESEESFKGQCSLKTWLFVIARNLCYSRRRNKSFHNTRIEGDISEKNYADSFDLSISMHEALMKISKESSELLYLKEFEGYSYKEISEMTKISVENVAVKLFRAKKQLRKYLKDFKE
jgi:RNA polymerase sigma-70 factor, ECF subfamily